MTRDEMIALMDKAAVDALDAELREAGFPMPPGGVVGVTWMPSALLLDAVLAAGDLRWLCGRDDPGCGPELVAQYPGVHNEARGCCEWLVLPDWRKP